MEPITKTCFLQKHVTSLIAIKWLLTRSKDKGLLNIELKFLLLFMDQLSSVGFARFHENVFLKTFLTKDVNSDRTDLQEILIRVQQICAQFRRCI